MYAMLAGRTRQGEANAEAGPMAVDAGKELAIELRSPHIREWQPQRNFSE
jgi:hypothetical protein